MGDVRSVWRIHASISRWPRISGEPRGRWNARCERLHTPRRLGSKVPKWLPGRSLRMRPRSQTNVVALTVLVLALLMMSCDPGAPYRIGIMRDDEGKLTLMYSDCDANTRLVRVAVARSGNKRTPLWEIRSSEPAGNATLEVVVGGDQPGFETKIALTELLDSGTFVAMMDRASGSGDIYSFDLRDLRTGQVYAGDDVYFSLDEFRKGALCR